MAGPQEEDGIGSQLAGACTGHGEELVLPLVPSKGSEISDRVEESVCRTDERGELVKPGEAAEGQTRGLHILIQNVRGLRRKGTQAAMGRRVEKVK